MNFHIKGQITCLSLAGFQSGSKRTSRFPPIKLRPHPPALLLKRNANSSWKDTLIQPDENQKHKDKDFKLTEKKKTHFE